MRDRGVKFLYGRWLIEGGPKVLLFDTGSVWNRLDEWKGDLWNLAGIPTPPNDTETNETILLGYLTAWFLGEVSNRLPCPFDLGFAGQRLTVIIDSSSLLANARKRSSPTSTSGKSDSRFLSAGSATSTLRPFCKLPVLGYEKGASSHSLDSLAALRTRPSSVDTSALDLSTSTTTSRTLTLTKKRANAESTTDTALSDLPRTVRTSSRPCPTSRLTSLSTCSSASPVR